MNIAFLIISICLLCLSYYFYQQIKKKKVNLEQEQKKKQQIEKQILQLKNNYQKSKKECIFLKDLKIQKSYQIDYLNNVLKDKEEYHQSLISKINDLKQQSNNFYNQEKKIVDQQLERYKENSSKAAQNYFENLEKAYEHADAAHAEKLARLKEEQDAAAADLNNLKETRKAAYEAVLKEKEIKEKSSFYTVQLDKKCLHDISLLNSISNQLIDSRPLNMVIWTSYYSKKVNELCSRIIGTEIKSGIYKITFLPTNQCYIGQAKDLKERIRTHIKAGSCHIDTPSNNKLYEKMGKNSIQNFTFQILEYCSIEKLNQKEKYYIDLYQSYDYGFNSNRGISK